MAQMTEAQREELSKLKTNLEKIYFKYNLLKAEAKEDTTLDKANLDSGFNVTMCLTKWITYKSEWARLYRDFEAKRKTSFRKLYEFYDVESARKLNTKAEYDLFIESDPQYYEPYNNAIVSKEVMAYCDSIIDTLKNKQWEIKSYIEYMKFINGR
jgi:phosphomevalonate kinase